MESSRQKADAASHRLQGAYSDRQNIVGPALEAAEAYLSIGEMVELLSEVAGQDELRRRGGFIIRLY